MYIRRARQARRRTAIPTKKLFPDSASTNHTHPDDAQADVLQDKARELWQQCYPIDTIVWTRTYFKVLEWASRNDSSSCLSMIKGIRGSDSKGSTQIISVNDVLIDAIMIRESVQYGTFQVLTKTVPTSIMDYNRPLF